MKTVAIGEAYVHIWLIQLKKNMLTCIFQIPVYLHVVFEQTLACFRSAGRSNARHRDMLVPGSVPKVITEAPGMWLSALGLMQFEEKKKRGNLCFSDNLV